MLALCPWCHVTIPATGYKLDFSVANNDRCEGIATYTFKCKKCGNTFIERSEVKFKKALEAE